MAEAGVAEEGICGIDSIHAARLGCQVIVIIQHKVAVLQNSTHVIGCLSCTLIRLLEPLS